MCTTNACHAPPGPGHDRLDVLDHLIDGEIGQYRAFTRLTGFREINASWAGTMSVTFDKAAGPFDIIVDKDIVKEYHRPKGGFTVNNIPMPPCNFNPYPAWCDPDTRRTRSRRARCTTATRRT